MNGTPTSGDPQKQFSKLQRLINNQDFSEAIQVCNTILSAVPENHQALQAKAYCNLELGRWHEALHVTESSRDLSYEKAIALYRLNKYDDANTALDAAKDQDGANYLRAQILHRMGKYQECAELYTKLYEEDPGDVQVFTNLLAALVGANMSSEALAMIEDGQVPPESDNSYEVAFNQACAQIDSYDLAEAASRLADAKDLCVGELEDANEKVGDLDGNDEDGAVIHRELASIIVQTAYLLQRRGEFDLAHDLYQKAMRQPDSDVTALAVAANNVVAMRPQGKNLFDSMKRISIASKESLEHKLSTKQASAIAVNKCLLLLQAHKVEEAKKAIQELQRKFSGDSRVTIVEAALAWEVERKGGKAEEILQNYLQKHTGDADVSMSLAQLYLTTNRPDKAASTLTDMPLKCRVQPSLLATLVDLLTRGKAKSDVGTKEAAVKALREGMQHWAKDSSAVGKQCYAKVLAIAAQTAERIGDYQLATDAYGAHLENCGDDSKSRILRGYVRALSVTDPNKAKKFMNRLKVPSLVTMDPEEIEQAAPPRLFNKTAAISSKPADKPADQEKSADVSAENTAEKEKTEEGAEAAATTKAKKKRKNKIRYPKDFDPENPGPPPDPERWIPKRERAGAKKKKGKNPMRGNQGATPGDDDFRNQKTSATVQASTDKSKRKGRKKR